MIPEPLKQYLDSKQANYRVLSHAPRPTAQETAAAAHVSGWRFAKTVLLRVRNGEPSFVLCLLPASEVIDLARLGSLLGREVKLATEPDFVGLFPDFEAGAAPPFGELARAPGIPVVADACLTAAGTLVFNGGTHQDLIEMSWKDFRRIANPQVIDYGLLQGISAPPPM
ncbi:MAG: YbaK/EbsC family protein [Deltaproteobacteria bacterium]|nr:YbaK/EbsC family protein [Deltaproteobacteria bacterium]